MSLTSYALFATITLSFVLADRVSHLIEVLAMTMTHVVLLLLSVV